MTAKQLQADRDAVNLQNHRERLVWLTADAPKWSCGEPVDSHTRNTLLVQSKAALAQAGAST